jgi:hypothetical protein
MARVFRKTTTKKQPKSLALTASKCGNNKKAAKATKKNTGRAKTTQVPPATGGAEGTYV